MMKRRTVVSVGSVVLSMAVALPTLAQRQQPAQRGGPPAANTPSIVVTAFSTNNRKLAVEAADELRSRIQSEHSARELYAVPKNQIEATLSSSGYPTDSALSASDLMELSRSMRGEYAIDGKATKVGSGNAVRLETRILLRTGNITLSQPLPPAEGKDLGDAARIVERSLAEALKGMPNYNDCISDLRAQNYEKAEKDADSGSRRTRTRCCRGSVAGAGRAQGTRDSVIANATAILATIQRASSRWATSSTHTRPRANGQRRCDKS